MVLRLSTFPADVRGAVLTGFSTATNAAVVATDTVLAALGKLQAQVSVRSESKIAEVIVGTATATVSFSSIPATYRHLRLVYQARGDNAVEFPQIWGQFNGDTGANYDGQGFFAGGSGVSSNEVLNNTSVLIGSLAGTLAVANATGAGEIVFHNYAGTTFFKTFYGTTWVSGTSAAAHRFAELFGGQWRNTAAINTILVSASAGNFVTGSTFTLYGMA